MTDPVTRNTNRADSWGFSADFRSLGDAVADTRHCAAMRQCGQFSIALPSAGESTFIGFGNWPISWGLVDNTRPTGRESRV